MVADNDTLGAMARLQHNRDFAAVMAYVRLCQIEQVTYCLREHDEVLVRRAQGAAMELATFIDLCANAARWIDQRREEAESLPQSESYI